MTQCEFCKSPAQYKGETIMGAWACMCQKHFVQFAKVDTATIRALFSAMVEQRQS